MRKKILVISFSVAMAPLCFSFTIESRLRAFPGEEQRSSESRKPAADSGDDLPDLNDLNVAPSEMKGMIERYAVDRGSLNRSFPVDVSPARRTRLKHFYTEWLAALERLDFDAMGHPGKVDYVLFDNHLEHELRQLDIQARQAAEMEPLIAFGQTLIELAEARRRMEPVDAPKAAELLTALKKQLEQTQKTIAAGLRPAGKPAAEDESKAAEKVEAQVEPVRAKKTVANRAANAVNHLKNTLKNWFTFYNSYDPVFTWWLSDPYKQADEALQKYIVFLRERVVGVNVDDREAIIGDPIGREALLSELAYEMIPYTPEELIAIGKKEMAWCEAELVRASRELGYGDDWKKALEHVKALHVEPGKQPELIRRLAVEAIDFIDQHDLVTVPKLARETWRMEMMSPERQLVNPFFTGGETISVSYPTSTMGHEQKMMSMRGNNIHFSRATVFHELVPGHHLQGFMTARYRPYRSLFSTPFGGEGWALSWELLLWDLNFPRSPEDRIGMLFWRMHRSARIIFSLSFHLEQMTPQECVDFLVERVGHERDNAAGEVRRSFGGGYGPLYQAAYLLGGLQFRALQRDMVGSGKMTNRAFHDAILKENRIPVEMIRAILTRQTLGRDFQPSWKFYGANSTER